MSILQIFAALIIGVVILVLGIAKKNKWILLVSAIPLLVALSQIIILIFMAQH